MRSADDQQAPGHGLRSMTGYGRGESAEGAFTAVAEINSVNRRQLDVRLQLPRWLALREAIFTDRVKARLSRGHVNASVQVISKEAADGVNGVSYAQLHSAVEAIRKTAAKLGLTDDLSASHLLQLSAGPGASQETGPHAAAESAAVTAFAKALDELCRMRAVEGARLECDLRQHLESLRLRVSAIEACAPDIPVAYRELLQRRLSEAGHAAALDDEVLRRELLLFATRSDVTEEITRLYSHFEQVSEFLQKSEPVGRALDFLVQEMSREINTLGAKAADARISREVVGFKTELDRFREQVQNVE